METFTPKNLIETEGSTRGNETSRGGAASFGKIELFK